MSFEDREAAGRQLAGRLRHLFSERPVVVALSRGGVLVASEIAPFLAAPLYFMPAHPEKEALAGRTLILVDDELSAESLTVEELEELKADAPARIVVVAPVCSPSAAHRLRHHVDDVICLYEPEATSRRSPRFAEATEIDEAAVERALANHSPQRYLS